MRFILPFFILLATVSATSGTLIARQSLPTCAVTCLANANTGSCGQADDSCLCKDQAFINSTTTCIESTCSGSDLQNAEAYAQQLCLAVGVTLTVPTATATAINASTSTTSAKPTSSSSSSSSGASITSRTSSMGVLAGVVAAVAVAAVL